MHALILFYIVLYGPADKACATRLKAIKMAIKNWRNVEREKESKLLVYLKNKINDIEIQTESRALSDLEKQDRLLWKKELLDLELTKCLDLKQKARIKWALD